MPFPNCYVINLKYYILYQLLYNRIQEMFL